MMAKTKFIFILVIMITILTSIGIAKDDSFKLEKELTKVKFEMDGNNFEIELENKKTKLTTAQYSLLYLNNKEDISIKPENFSKTQSFGYEIDSKLDTKYMKEIIKSNKNLIRLGEYKVGYLESQAWTSFDAYNKFPIYKYKVIDFKDRLKKNVNFSMKLVEVKHQVVEYYDEIDINNKVTTKSSSLKAKKKNINATPSKAKTTSKLIDMNYFELTTINGTDFDPEITDYYTAKPSGVFEDTEYIASGLHLQTERDALLIMKMDGNNAQDSSSYGNDGTVNGATWNATGGHDGYGAYEFDGNNITRATINVTYIHNTYNYTLSAWVYIKGNSSEQFPVIFSSSTYGNKYMEFDYGQARLSSIVRHNDYPTTGDTVSTYNCPGGVSGCLNKWIYVVATVDDYNVSIYINGVLEDSDAHNSNLVDGGLGGNIQTIGGRSSWGTWNGTIDDVQIFNRSLSQEEITALYTSEPDYIPAYKEQGNYTSVQTRLGYITNMSNAIITINGSFDNDTVQTGCDSNDPNLVSCWNFDGDVLDSAGNNDGVINDALPTFEGVNGSYYFDGITSKVNVTDDDSLDFTTNMTVMLRFKTGTTGTQTMIDKRGEYKIGTSSASKLAFAFYSTGAWHGTSDQNTVIYDNEWYHVAGTFDGQFIKMYVDGVLVDTGEWNGSMIPNPYKLNIGTYIDAQHFTGSIDDVRIYNSTKSGEEVLEIYREILGNQIELKMCVANETSATNFTACYTSTDLDVSTGIFSLPANMQRASYFQYKLINTLNDTEFPVKIESISFTFDDNDKPTQNTPTITSTTGKNFTTDNLTVYNVSTTSSEFSSVKNIYNWKLNGSSVTVLNMPFEGNTGNESGASKDYSGFGNNGTVTSATWNISGGYDGFGAYEFDGETDYVEILDDASLHIGNHTTFSFWLYWNALNTANTILSKNTNSGGPSYLIRTDSGGRLEFYVQGFTPATIEAPTVISLNTWTHVAYVMNGTHTKTYFDGDLKDTDSHVAGTYVFNTQPFSIGAWDNGPSYIQFWNGSIDEVQMFNRTLSAEQILNIYNNRTDLLDSEETSLGDNWSACITPNDGYEDGETKCSETLTIIENTAPTTTLVILNSTDNPLNRTTANLTCYATLTDNTDTSIQANYTWYLNDTFYSTGQSSSFNINTNTLITTLDSSLTSVGDNWTCEVSGYDGIAYETTGLNSTALTILKYYVEPLNVNFGAGIEWLTVNWSAVSDSEFSETNDTSGLVLSCGSSSSLTCSDCSETYVNLNGDNMTGGLNIDGNVGIGTTTPLGQLSLKTDSRVLTINQGTSGAGATYNTNDWHLFQSDGTSIVSIGGDSGVGIGIGRNYIHPNEAPIDGLIVEGNVGIGTKYPSSKLNVVGDANITGNFTGNQFYGEVWMHNDTATGRITTINTLGVWENVSFDDTENGQKLNGFTYSDTESLTVNVAGLYKTDYSISFERASGGVTREYKTVIAINGIIQDNTEAHRKTGSVNDVGNAGGTGFLQLAVNDLLNVQIVNEGGTEDAGIHTLNLNLVRIGD